ncbi:MAG: sigma 54-interacting transcriptional regulator [Muribaculum sp.]|nr:sigma 54-interacting transcriptional regulator [Muribaculum sp.]
MANIEHAPPSVRRLLIYSSRIEDGRKIEEMISKRGFTARISTEIRDAKKIIEQKGCDCLVVAVTGEDCDGMKLLEWTNDTILSVIKYGVAISNNHTLYNKVFKLGANYCFYFDSLTIDNLTSVLDKVYCDSENFKWHQRNSCGFESCAKKILSETQKETTLLTVGAQGTGKTAIARLIHNHSPRRNYPFVVAECSHYDDPLKIMDIFKGKDTGTKNPFYKNQQGLLAQANGGTLYIHEVCHLPLNVQEVLATVVERRVFTPHNLNKEIKFSGRIIFSTKVDLGELVAKGEFSEKLYLLIHRDVLRVPPLSDCQDDIIPLAEAFIYEICKSNDGSIPILTEGAKNKLRTHIWNGNVRELYTTVSRACMEYRGSKIGKDDIILTDVSEAGSKHGHSRRYRVMKALRYTKGNKAQAAKILGVNRTTIYTWIKEENIPLDYM